jgi:hypothetical protein
MVVRVFPSNKTVYVKEVKLTLFRGIIVLDPGKDELDRNRCYEDRQQHGQDRGTPPPQKRVDLVEIPEDEKSHEHHGGDGAEGCEYSRGLDRNDGSGNRAETHEQRDGDGDYANIFSP